MMLDQKSELAKQQKEFDRLLQEKEESKIRAVEDLTVYYEAKLREKATKLDQVLEGRKKSLKVLEETQKQIEEETEREIKNLKNKYKMRLRAEKQDNKNLIGETGFLKKQIKRLQQEIDEQKEKMKESDLENAAQTHVIQSLERINIGLKNEIREKDDTLRDKENINVDLKVQNEELTNFQFVLEYKILELQNLLEPKENDIRKMNDKIKEMENELERVNTQNTDLKLNVEELKRTLKAKDKGMEEERQKENASLVQEIGDLRRELKIAKSQMRIQKKKKRRSTKLVVTSTGAVTETESENNEKHVKTIESHILRTSDFGSTLPSSFHHPSINQATSKLAIPCPRAQKQPRENTEIVNIEIRSLHTAGLKFGSGSHSSLPPVKQAASKY